MQTKLNQIVYLPVAAIVRDEAQPRQCFDELKLGRLSDSIRKMGIKEPLTVEKMPDGTYKLIDGERRWRSAVAIGLKEVPVIISGRLSNTDRLIEQFHIQEMREGWLADEKASAIYSLAQTLDISFVEATKMVGLPARLASAYSALMQLSDRPGFIKSRLNIDLAAGIGSVIKTAVTQVSRQLQDVMTDDDVKRIQDTVQQKLISGEFKGREEMKTLRDAFVKDAKNVALFLKGATPAQLFRASDAGGIRAYRRTSMAMNNLVSLTRELKRSKEGVLHSQTDTVFQSRLKAALRELNALVHVKD